MEQTSVTCPNCGGSFMVHVRATRGKCPHCTISLIYETVREPPKLSEPPKSVFHQDRICGQDIFSPDSPIPKQTKKQERVNLLYIEQVVDAMGHEGTVSKTSISDIAVIETLNPDIDHPSIEKNVDRLLRSRSKTKV